MSDGVRDRMLD